MKRLSFILVICLSTTLFGQKKDAHLWSGIGLELGINKKVEVKFETQVRLDQNFGRLAQYYSEIGGSYEIGYGFQTSLTYRYSRKNDGDYYFNENRVCLDASWKYKTEFGLSARLKGRYQHSFNRFREINGIYPDRKNKLRFSLKLDYEHPDFKLIQPFFTPEIFFDLQPDSPGSVLDTYRFKTGITLDLPKRHEVKLFYMFEHENRKEDNLNHIYCIQYNYSFKSLYKRKK